MTRDVHENKVYSGKIVERDSRGCFLKGHKKLGGRKTGSPNFNTKALRIIENLDFAEIDRCTDRELLIKTIINIAINGKPTASTTMTLFLFNLLDR